MKYIICLILALIVVSGCKDNAPEDVGPIYLAGEMETPEQWLKIFPKVINDCEYSFAPENVRIEMKIEPIMSKSNGLWIIRFNTKGTTK